MDFIDLRVAVVLRLRRAHAEADALLVGVASLSLLNHGLIADLYEATTADYRGAVPLPGTGSQRTLSPPVQEGPGRLERPRRGGLPRGQLHVPHEGRLQRRQGVTSAAPPLPTPLAQTDGHSVAAATRARRPMSAVARGHGRHAQSV